MSHLQAVSTLYARLLEMMVRARRGVAADADALEALRASRAAVAACEARDGMPSQQLAKRLGMIPSELAVVLLLGSISANADVRRLAAALGHQSPEDPTIDVIRTIIFGTECGRDAFAALAPAGTLRRLGVIERSDGGGADVHESRQTWAIARRVLAWLHGDTSIDPAIAAAVRIAEPKAIADVIVADETVAEVREACRAKRAVIVASGATGLGRRTLLAAAAREAGIDVLEIDARRLGKDQLRAVARECKLLGRAPLVCHADDHIEAIGRELAPEIDGPIFVTAQRAAIRWDRPAIVVHVTAPSSAQRARLWRAALPEASERDAEHLATQYPLAPALVHHAAQAIRVRAPDRSVRPADVDAGVRAVLDDRLAELARPVRVTQTWDDLVLPDEQHAAIAELCARVRQRSTVFEDWGFAAKVGKGFGTVALLSGPPGTGKTMVAGLVARELGLPLYQVDSAKITSKFIGETEKQLAQLFDAAEAGCAILLFDEADSLFGKRTQIADSNDRYANLETNYLLQRLESFTGICLLTTNHEASLDPAFQRRLALHVRFELPDETERARLWRALLPAAAPVDPGIDFADLARRFALSGGHIRNATVRAAFVAADEGTPIAEAHLEHAARVEAEAAGKLAA